VLNTTDTTRYPGSSYPTIGFFPEPTSSHSFVYIMSRSTAAHFHVTTYIPIQHGGKRIIRCRRGMIKGIDRPTLYSKQAIYGYCPMLTALDKLRNKIRLVRVLQWWFTSGPTWKWWTLSISRVLYPFIRSLTRKPRPHTGHKADCTALYFHT
jgi:hypothetical protein